MVNSDPLGTALRVVMLSDNEMDRNGESANVVDALFFIGRAIHHLAEVIEAKGGREADE